MATPHQRLRGRPAHPPGQTYLTYTPDGRRLVTVGANNAIRVYTTGSDGEPKTVDNCQELHTAVATTNDFFIAGSEDGMVSMYSLQNFELDSILTRTASMPVRDIAISPDGQWCAVASDELTVRLVDTQDYQHFMYLRDQPKPVKHLSFDFTGKLLAVSCSDGIVYIYSIASDAPQVVKKIDGLIRPLETDKEMSSMVAWHPDGRAIAAPTATRDIQVLSTRDWSEQNRFSDGHTGDITALAWSLNGAVLATAGTDGKLLLWETRSQKIIARYDYPNIMSISWHPTDNLLSFSTTDGEVYMFTLVIPPDHLSLLSITLQPAPFLDDSANEPVAEDRNQAQIPIRSNGDQQAFRLRQRSPDMDSLDDIINGEDEAFVEDDDGAGYLGAVNGNGKRTNGHLGGPESSGKRRAYSDWRPQIHESFQPGSTPWRGNRRYLCLNLTGCVWTVDQDTHHTVTVEFYDREYHRDFHFTDPYMYDIACLNDKGTLFSCPSKDTTPATIFYRPHETWTARADWRISLPSGEDITALSLSTSYIVALTTTNYIRIYTLFGTPLRVYRQKASPAVTCASWRDYVLTLGNGPLGPDGATRLTYTIEDIRRDTVCQAEDTVALAPGTQLKSVFFSDAGDPCIYDSSGVLLVLLHWRTPGQARWVPLLDTRQLDRLAGGRKDETYWPVAIAQDRFHCIILKGADTHPYFPRPLLTEFEFRVPLSSFTAADEEDNEGDGASAAATTRALEETFVRHAVSTSLQQDLLEASSSGAGTASQRAELARREIEVDKALLQLLAVECREGEERGMKALEIVKLMRDQSGRMLEAAGKVAERYGRGMLGERIREVAERRAGGVKGDDEGEEYGEGGDVMV